CDDVSVPAVAAALMPTVSEPCDLVVVILPKSREQLAFWLAAVRGQLNAKTEVWLVGAANGGVRGGVTTLETLADEAASQFDSARHCKVFSCTLSPAPFVLTEHEQVWSLDDLAIVSYPGVFSHGRLDAGSALLLATLPAAGWWCGLRRCRRGGSWRGWWRGPAAARRVGLGGGGRCVGVVGEVSAWRRGAGVALVQEPPRWACWR